MSTFTVVSYTDVWLVQLPYSLAVICNTEVIATIVTSSNV